MGKVRSYAVSLVLLGLFCLVVEQVSYCFFVPRYFFQLMISPVLWGSISVICFFALWKTRVRKLREAGDSIENAEQTWDYDPVFDDPMSMANPDNMFSRNLRCW